MSSIVSWTQHITLHCLAQNSESKPTVIALPPQATVLISGCTGQTVSDVDSYLHDVNQHSQKEIQAYELVSDGGIGTIAAFGLAVHSRNQDIILSGIPFTDPGLNHAANSVFAGVPFGTQAALPDGVYKPRISFSNFSTIPAHISVSIATTPPGATSTSPATSALPEKRLLQQLTVAPRRTAEFMLNDPGSQAGLQQSLVVETDRKPGEVLSKVVSRSDGNLFEIELLGKDQMDEDNGGSHPWSVDGDSVSHLLLFNYSDKSRVFRVGISNGAIVWDKKYSLAQYETREISINELIDDEIHDDKGQVLSPYKTGGVVNWMVPDSGEGTGRLMVTSRSRALARNFSCGQFIVVCGMTFVTSWNGVLPVNDTLALYTADPNFCDEFGPNQCYGGSSVGGGSANYSWSIGASSIVTPSSSSSYSPSLHGVSPGSGSADVTATAGGCSSYGYGNPQVTSCPTTTSLGGTEAFLLSSQSTPPWLSGLGLVANMQAGPSGQSYTGVMINESVSPAGGTCSSALQNEACQATGNGLFVDQAITGAIGPSGFNSTYPPITNVFYDEHGLATKSGSFLANGQSCTIICSQTYSCGGNSIGSYTITMNLSGTTLNQAVVTDVAVSKSHN